MYNVLHYYNVRRCDSQVCAVLNEVIRIVFHNHHVAFPRYLVHLSPSVAAHCASAGVLAIWNDANGFDAAALIASREKNVGGLGF